MGMLPPSKTIAAALRARRVGPWANTYVSLLRQIELLDHANEIGNGANAQFLHHPAAVDLDGFFDRTQIPGNLLVEPTCRHMRKHFAFARCQGTDLRLDRFHLGMKPTRLGVPGFRTGYSFEQILVLYGLGQEIDRPGFHGAHAGGNVAFAGDEHDRTMITAGYGQRALNLQTIKVGHRDIEYGAAGNGPGGLVEE